MRSNESMHIKHTTQHLKTPPKTQPSRKSTNKYIVLGTPAKSNKTQHLCYKFHFYKVYTFSDFIDIIKKVISLLC